MCAARRVFQILAAEFASFLFNCAEGRPYFISTCPSRRTEDNFPCGHDQNFAMARLFCLASALCWADDVALDTAPLPSSPLNFGAGEFQIKLVRPSRSMIHSATRTSNERTLPPLYLVPRLPMKLFQILEISICSIAQRSKSSKVVEEVDVE